MDGSLPFNPAANVSKPEIFESHQGTSPALFLFQHSGYAVPKNLHDAQGRPLGLPPEWFDTTSPKRRHEAADWGTSELADALATLMPHASILRANISRLVVDLNRKRSAAEVIPSASSEHVDWIIPGNIGISAEEREQRLREFFDPYHQAVAEEIARIKQKYGYVIVIDMHSFTPEWHGQKRSVEIGTLYTSENALARALNNALDTQAPGRFTPNAPYAIAKREDNGGHVFEQEHRLNYVGVEVRQDLLSTPSGLHQNAQIIASAAHEVQRKLTPDHKTEKRPKLEAVYT